MCLTDLLYLLTCLLACLLTCLLAYLLTYLLTYFLYLQPVCPLFWGLNPPKQGPFQTKQGSFGFQVLTLFQYFTLLLYSFTLLYFSNKGGAPWSAKCLRKCNPFVRSCVSIARTCGAGCNPFVESCVWIARNCSNSTICYLLEQPFRKIVRVDRTKL